MLPILALDLSKSRTGWAFGTPGEKPTSGFAKAFGTEADSNAKVGAEAVSWLIDMVRVMKPEVIAIEAAWGGGGKRSAHTAALLIGLNFAMAAAARRLIGREPIEVRCETAREVFTGRGRYPKDEGKLAVQAEVVRRGWLSAADVQPDRCDALCVWAYAAAKQLPELAFQKQKGKS